VQAPFSDAILAGNTLYLAGRIGIDPKTARYQKRSRTKSSCCWMAKKKYWPAGMTMDDLVYRADCVHGPGAFWKVQSDLRELLHDKDFPARDSLAAGFTAGGRALRIEAIPVKTLKHLVRAASQKARTREGRESSVFAHIYI